MNFHRSVLCKNPGCQAEVDVSCGLDPFCGLVTMTVTCENGHVKKMIWQPGQPPPAEAMPFIPGLVQRQ